MKKDYKTLEEWKFDFDKIEQNPNDSKFIQAVAIRIERSSNTLKKEIKEYLADSILETNPWYIFKQISNQYPEYKILIKDKQDPWFSA